MDRKNSTEKLFVSPSTGKPCDSAQYLAELMCKRKAERNGIGLGDHFWNSEAHKKEFQGQIVSARKLLKKFTANAIISYLKGAGKNVFSLGHYTPLKFVITGIEIEEKRLKAIEAQAKVIETVTPEVINEKPQKQFKKKNSLLSKIKKVENNGESS